MPVPSAISDLSTTPASNSPAGSETPSSVDDYLRTLSAFVKRVADEAHIWCGTASGTANALVLTPPSAITSYGAGKTFRFKAASNNSAATTIAVSGLAVIDLEVNGAACIGGEIVANNWYEVLLSSATKAQLIGSYRYATGDITMSGASIKFSDGSAQASAQVGMKNRIINGGFILNQRGYVSGTALAANAYGHDRFKGGAAGGTYTFTQGALGVNTTINITAGTMVQIIEGCNVAEGGDYVLSWTGTAQGRLNGGAYGASGTVTVTGWVAGTNLPVEFNTGTVGSIQLEKGSIASSFDYRDYGRELIMCQRYVQKIYPSCAVSSGTANIVTAVQHLTPTRAAATYILEGPLTITNGAANYSQSSASIAASNQTVYGASINADMFSGLTGSTIYVAQTTNAIIAMAEI